jgi:anti-sigma B factor antagonist
MVVRYPIEWADGTTRVYLTGEIDLGVADEALQALTDAVLDGRSRHVVVDLAEVSLLDSTGIGAIAAARTMAVRQGRTFVVTNPGAMVRRVLVTTGMLDVLTGTPGRATAADGP